MTVHVADLATVTNESPLAETAVAPQEHAHSFVVVHHCHRVAQNDYDRWCLSADGCRECLRLSLLCDPASRVVTAAVSSARGRPI